MTRADKASNEKDPASNDITHITAALTNQRREHPIQNAFNRLATNQKNNQVLGYSQLEEEEEAPNGMTQGTPDLPEVNKVQKNNPVLRYLEEEEPSCHENSVEERGEADLEEIVPQPALRRQTGNTRAQAPAGAYSGAAGEEYQRLRKVENCAEHLGRMLPNSEVNIINNGDALEATLEPGNPKWWQQKKSIVIGFAIASLLVALSIAIPVALLQRGSAKDPATEGGFQIEEPKTIHDIDFRALIPNITNATINAIIEDPFSQQFRAYDFISRDPDWHSYEDWRKQQRFAVTCHLYAIDDWKFYRPAPFTHECNWAGLKACNDMGKVTSLSVGRPLYPLDMPGTIPLEIGFLSDMEQFEIVSAPMGDMEKALPLEIIQSLRPMLKELRLHDVDMVGTIPSTLGLLTGLTSLYLSDNGLTGSIPEEIGNLYNLTIFNVEDNSDLEVSVPAGFCSGARLLPWDTLLTDWCKDSDECCGSS